MHPRPGFLFTSRRAPGSDRNSLHHKHRLLDAVDFQSNLYLNVTLVHTADGGRTWETIFPVVGP